MADYLSVPIEVDSATLEGEAIAYLEAQVPGWTANPANLETWIIQAVARMAHEAALVASEIPTSVFRYFGSTIAGLPPNDGASATLAATVLVADTTEERVLPAGTFLDVEGYAFETTNAVTIAVGVASSGVGELEAAAVDLGTGMNGLTEAVTVDSIAWLESIDIVGASSGGAAAETDEDYLARLVEELRLLSPRPIIPADFESLAKRVEGVHRAVAIDGYNVAHNLLTVNQASLETDTVGWVADFNATIARDTTLGGADGSANLKITATASNDTSAQTLSGANAVPITAGGGTFTALAQFRPAVTTRAAQVGIRWYNAANGLISSSYGDQVNVSAGSWTPLSATFAAPVLAVKAAVIVLVRSAAAGEVHHVDKIALREGASTTWSAGLTPATNQERMIAVALLAEDGTLVGATAKAAVDALLQSYREVNFIVHVTDPGFIATAVVFAAKAAAGYDPAAVELEAEAAVDAYLSSATWGQPTSSQEARWINTTVVRYLEVAEAIQRVDGIDYVTSLTINGASVDVTLPGSTPVPYIGTATDGTVTA